MKKEFAIFLLFIVAASAIFLRFIVSTPAYDISKLDAGGFGISPPYLKALEMKPGDTYTQDIRVLRGDSDKRQKVTARFDALKVDDWVTILPSDTVVMEEGVESVRFKFEINIPEDAYMEKHRGRLYFAISAEDEKSGGVAVALGARAEVEIDVVEGRTPASDLKISLGEQEIVSRLQGRFIVRPQSRGELYYVLPNERAMYELPEVEDFSTLLREEARGINSDLLAKIPADTTINYGLAVDSDDDGLIDRLEEALGTDLHNADSDGDGYSDKDELQLGFSPLEKDTSLEYSDTVASSLAGYLLLQVEGRGQIWYVDIETNKRVLLVDIKKDLDVMKSIALGVSEVDFAELIKN